ncbi:hypothetical protein M5585_08475 [Serratia ureilytica]
MLVVQQRELRQFDESEESFMVTRPRRWPGSCHNRSLTPFSASIAKRACALAASPGVAVAEGWQDSSQPSLDQVYRASTLDTASERERLTLALEEAGAEFRRFSKRFAASSQRRARRSSIFTLTC